MLSFMLVAGVAMAAVGIAFAIGHALPWLLIVAGAWLLVRAMRGGGNDRESETGHAARACPRSSTGTAARQPDRTGPASRAAKARARRELPIDVQVKVDQIRRKADVLLGYADRFPPFSQDLHIVRQTTAEYLPRTVNAYLAIVSDGDPVISARGTTALDELRAQLGLLDSKLDEVAQNLERQDVDRLLANRRFLEERFRTPEAEEHADRPRQETDAA